MQVFRFFVGDGTADNPDAGLWVGDGFSYTAATCPTGSCDGGSGGVFGSGGNGYNGGNGGWAGWFGNGGNGGAGANGKPFPAGTTPAAVAKCSRYAPAWSTENTDTARSAVTACNSPTFPCLGHCPLALGRGSVLAGGSGQLSVGPRSHTRVLTVSRDDDHEVLCRR